MGTGRHTRGKREGIDGRTGTARPEAPSDRGEAHSLKQPPAEPPYAAPNVGAATPNRTPLGALNRRKNALQPPGTKAQNAGRTRWYLPSPDLQVPQCRGALDSMGRIIADPRILGGHQHLLGLPGMARRIMRNPQAIPVPTGKGKDSEDGSRRKAETKPSNPWAPGV